MVDRVDLVIAVIAIVVSTLGSTTAMWLAIAKKPDRQDLASGESKLDARIDRLEDKFDARFDRLEDKLDAIVLRLLPEARS